MTLDGGVQSKISGLKVGVLEVPGVAAEDMKIILKYIYTELDAIPVNRLQSLVVATHLLEV